MHESDSVTQQGHHPDADHPTTDHHVTSDPPLFDLRLLEAVCSRLCHDVINPVSAVNNGIELLQEQPQDTEIAALITENAQTAQMRLKLFRAAFGRRGLSSSAMASSDNGLVLVKQILDENLRAKNITLEWQHDHERQHDHIWAQSAIPPILSKLVLNLVLAAAEDLPKGGILKLSDRETPSGTLTLTITACDPQGVPDQNFPEYFKTKRFSQPNDTTDSKHAHGLLAVALSNHIGAIIDIQETNHQNMSSALHLQAPLKPLL